MAFAGSTVALRLVREGKLRALAVIPAALASSTRSADRGGVGLFLALMRRAVRVGDQGRNTLLGKGDCRFANKAHCVIGNLDLGRDVTLLSSTWP